MKYLAVIFLTALCTIFAADAHAQRDAYTSSARAAYSMPSINTELNVKKNKKNAKKTHAKKNRKTKMKDRNLARVRRSSLHF